MKIVKLFGFACAFIGSVACAADLTGSAFVNVTSDTAATAKNMAWDEARRQVLIDTLAPYSDTAALRAGVAKEKASVLTGLIASSAISGEKTSDTTYSAKITMTVNKVAAKDWLNANEIQNWVSVDDNNADTFRMAVALNNRLVDWIQIRKIAADAGARLKTLSIGSGQIVFEVPRAYRSAVTLAARDAGLQYSDNEGVLYIHR